MIRTRTAGESPLVVVGTGTGVTLIPSPTQLTRLNYFDGKFLRAEDLSAEQNYLRSLVQLSNQAGGAGVVHGFDTRLGATGALELGPGMAIDRAGRVLLLPHPTSVGVAELIERSRNPAAPAGPAAAAGGRAGFSGCAEPAAGQPPATSVLPAELYLVVLGHAEALCGEEDVYGKLCEDACSPDTNRRFRVEGVVLRAVPVSLDPPTTTSASLARKHLRSLAASAYYATERARLGREMSGARLRSDLWCHPAPVEHWPVEAGEGVPLALLSVTGGVAEWLDAWTARRERMEAPPKKAWAWQMMMRPWEVFLAQVLQFQCQLHDVLTGGPPPGGGDPCEDRRRLLERARAIIERIERRYDTVTAQPVGGPAALAPPPAAPAARRATGGREMAVPAYPQVREVRPDYLPELEELQKQILVALDEGAPGSARVLVDGGIVELPPAGYLPVVPGREVDEQVRQLLGEGVDLRFCAVRPDYVAHALEEAQHLDRIGLLQGLEDPTKRPEVDVLVPDGEVIEKPAAPPGHLFEVVVRRVPRAPQQTVGTPNAAVPAPGQVPPAAVAADQQVPGAAAAGDEQDPGGDDGAGESEQGSTLLRGAGRSHALPGGGGAFHFAGVSGVLSRLSMPKTDHAVGVGLASGARTFDAAGMKRGSGARRAAGTIDEAGTGSTAGFRVPRVPGIDEALGRMFRAAGATRTTRAAADGAAEMQTRELTQITTPPSLSLANVTLGVWATLRCEGDPFALDVGESVAVRGEAVLGVDGVRVGGEPVPLSGRVRLAGTELVCRVPADGGSRMRGRLQGWAFTRTDTLADAAGAGSGTAEDEDGTGSGGNEEETPFPLDVPVELELRPAAAGGTELAATLYVPTDDGPLAVGFTTGWRGAPILAKSVAAMDVLRTLRERLRTATGAERAKLEEALRLIDTGALPATFPVLKADAREDPAVAAPGNPFHADAVRALRAISRVLDDPGFREAAERLLFPPPPKKPGTARVRATRDWVLFHRRRRSSCDCCPGAAVAAPPRRYRVYHTVLEDDPSPEEIREFLAGSQAPEDELQLLGITPEFEGGTTTLLTARGALLDAWEAAAPGESLYYGAIAGAGPGTGDPDALLDGRLDRLASVVAGATPEFPGAVFDVLARPPSWLSAGTADGVVVLLTYRPRDTGPECQEVFLVRAGAESAKRMGAFLQQGGSRESLLDFAQRVGEVRYQPGTTTVAGGSLEATVEAWGAGEPGIPRSAVYLSAATEAQTELRERHEQRARDVLDAIGAGAEPQVSGLPAGVSGCESVLLVVAGTATQAKTQTQPHRVVEVDNRDMLGRLIQAMSGGEGNAAFGETGARELGYVRFAAGTTTAEQATLGAVREASGGGGSPEVPVLVTPAKASPTQLGQADVIRNELGIGPSPAQVVAPLAGNEDVYGNAEVVTLVMPG